MCYHRSEHHRYDVVTVGTVTSAPPDLHVPPTRIRLLRETAAGPISAVFVGERDDGRRVAVKLLRDTPDGGVDHLFDLRDRARRVASLGHRHHACVQDIARVDARFALIAPFVDGIDLLDWVDVLGETGRLLPRRVTCEVLRCVAVALEAASAGLPGLASGPGLWHRDLKPSNVLITRDGELKVTDFATGYTSLAGRSARSGALKKGLVRYLSPERREGRRSQGEADVYAFGILALELFRGRWLRRLHSTNPAHDRHLADVVARVEDLQMRSDNDDRALRNLLLRMVAFDPDARPAIAEIAAAFRGFADRTAGPSLEAFANAHAVPWLEEPPNTADDAVGDVFGLVIDRGQPLPEPVGQGIAVVTLPDRYELQVQGAGTETGDYSVDSFRNEVTDPRLRARGGTDPRLGQALDAEEGFAEGPEEHEPEEPIVPPEAELWGAEEDLLVEPRVEAGPLERRPLPRPDEIDDSPQAAPGDEVVLASADDTSEHAAVEEVVLDEHDLIGDGLTEEDYDLRPDAPTDEAPLPGPPATAPSASPTPVATPAELVEEVEVELELDLYEEEDGEVDEDQLEELLLDGEADDPPAPAAAPTPAPTPRPGTSEPVPSAEHDPVSEADPPVAARPGMPWLVLTLAIVLGGSLILGIGALITTFVVLSM